jgi:hypothetical protein
VASRTAEAVGQAPGDQEYEEGRDNERAAQANLLRDIFGPLPFRSLALNPSLLQWRDSVIPRLAEAIYEERAFERMPILADALEEAGVTDQDILGHCRQPEGHIRGCWCLDLLLSRE